MVKPVILVNSITHAMKGQKVLLSYGISSNIVRNLKNVTVRGCGYGLALRSDPLTAQNILMKEGIKVVDIVEAEV